MRSGRSKRPREKWGDQKMKGGREMILFGSSFCHPIFLSAVLFLFAGDDQLCIVLESKRKGKMRYHWHFVVWPQEDGK